MANILLGGHALGFFANPYNSYFGHYFLVLSGDANLSVDDLIIRGGPNNGLLGAEVGVPYIRSEDYHVDWGEANSVENPRDYYGTTSLSVAPTDVPHVWQTMMDVAAQINDFSIAYRLVSQNSNTLVNTILKTVGLEPIVVQAENGEVYSYPGGEYEITRDQETGVDLSLVIRGSKYEEYSDNLYALDGLGGSGDYLTAYEGNDTLHDGSGTDILEGGAGDDIFELGNDEQADVVIAEGYDIIRGGDAFDRIVFRASDAPNPVYGPGFGTEADTKGIPLLGGFKDPFDGAYGYVTAFYEPSSETIQPDGYVEAHVPVWDEIAENYTYPKFEGGTGQGVTSSFNASYSYNLSTKELHISVKLFDTNEVSYYEPDAHIVIEDFEEGDFGIEFYDYGAHPQGGYTLADNSFGIGYVNNYGSFIDIPLYMV